MKRHIALLLILGLMPAVTPLAEESALGRADLAACASMALELRTRSPRLQGEAQASSSRRTELSQMHAALEPGREGDTDRWLRYNAAAAAFNQRMDIFRENVKALNRVKRDYHRRCHGRPYARSDLLTLPAAQQKAMQQGLSDVVVPFLAPADE